MSHPEKSCPSIWLAGLHSLQRSVCSYVLVQSLRQWPNFNLILALPVVSSRYFTKLIPALFTKTLIPPKHCPASSMAVFTSASTETSIVYLAKKRRFPQPPRSERPSPSLPVPWCLRCRLLRPQAQIVVLSHARSLLPRLSLQLLHSVGVLSPIASAAT